MTAMVPVWPVRQPLVAGNDWTCLVEMPAAESLTGTTWRAVVRSSPAGPAVAAFVVTVNAGAHELTLTMAGAASAAARADMGFDLTQLTPVERTIFTVNRLNVVGAYSHAAV